MSAQALEGFPESIPSTSRVSARRHHFTDESPALTAVLQAQPARIVPSSAGLRAGYGGVAGPADALAMPASPAGRNVAPEDEPVMPSGGEDSRWGFR